MFGLHFAGASWATLLPWFAAAAVATTLLYFLKLRRRAVPVPFAKLWERVLGDRESNQLFSQLKRWLSLLLQLIMLGLLFLALGDPRPVAQTARGRHIVVLMDASLSMQAVDEKPSRLERAKAEAKRFVRGLGNDDRAMIVQMDMHPLPLGPLTQEPSELSAAIDQVRAQDTPADLGRALAFAEDSLRGLPNPEVLLVSDGALDVPESVPAKLKFTRIAVGKSASNVAVIEFSARRYPLDKSRVEVLLEIENTNDRPAPIELTLYGDGAVIDVTHLNLAANEKLSRVYSGIAGVNRKLEAQVRLANGKSDDLPRDDRAYALMPERRRARVLLVSSGNTYLEAALLLDEYLDTTYVDAKAYPPKEAFDVTIFDGVAPTRAPHTGAALYLNPPKDGSPVKLEAPLTDFGFDRWERKHPALKFLALGDVQVARGQRLRPEAGDQILGASDLGPILVAGSRSGAPFMVLGFDPRDSDFVLRPAFPLFVLGVIDSFLADDISYLSSYQTGENWRVPTQSSATTAELFTPKNERLVVPVQAGRAAYFGNWAGFYRLSAQSPDQSEKSAHEFAANLGNSLESHIRPQPELKLGARTLQSASFGAPSIRRRSWAYFLIAVVALSIFEWFTYHRRVTV
ncbi:MAG TPA: VWA domain-containing protein [Polyangiaceae bacterium]|nr:VWA domain-containing protein [Polyangiaceae bacterium]